MRQVSLLMTGWVGLGLCLVAAGCQLQVAFVDSHSNSSQPPPGPAITRDGRPVTPTSSIIQTGGTLPAPNPVDGGPTLDGPILPGTRDGGGASGLASWAASGAARLA
jgi:hypothetical protein